MPVIKIGLIAMSGLRAWNPELTRLGWTLPGFMERSRVIASLPSLSLLTLAGMTPDRFEVSYSEVKNLGDLSDLPSCDVAAISTFTAQAKDAYELARRYREIGVWTVLGGLHASAVPQEALAHFDTVCVGQGELVWPEFLRDLEAGCPKWLYRATGDYDLGDSPMPRFDLLNIEDYNRLTVQTQRGCPWRCEFCASSITLTSRYEIKPVERVLAEVRAIKCLWKRPFIEFADDNTFVNKRHSKELMRALATEEIRWFTETDISVADDPELLQLMAEAGCAQVLIGLESPTSAGLDGLELNQNWKRKRLDTYIDAIQRVQSHGITVNGCFVLGLDGHDTGIFDAVWDFVERSGLYEVQISVATAFPGTPYYERLLQQGRLIEPTAWERCTLFDVNVRPDGMSVHELEQGLVSLGSRLYSDQAKQERVKRYRQQLRASLRSKKEKTA